MITDFTIKTKIMLFVILGVLLIGGVVVGFNMDAKHMNPVAGPFEITQIAVIQPELLTLLQNAKNADIEDYVKFYGGKPIEINVKSTDRAPTLNYGSDATAFYSAKAQDAVLTVKLLVWLGSLDSTPFLITITSSFDPVVDYAYGISEPPTLTGVGFSRSVLLLPKERTKRVISNLALTELTSILLFLIFYLVLEWRKLYDVFG